MKHQLFKWLTFLTFFVGATSVALAQGSIRMNDLSGGTVNGAAGTQFTIEVELGNPTAVSDLVGVSFNLDWDNAAFISAANAAVGDFFAPSPLFVAQPFADHYEVGVTSTSGGKSGSGLAATFTLEIAQDITSATTLNLTISNLSGLDGIGNPVALTIENNPVSIDLQPVVTTVPSIRLSGPAEVAGSAGTSFNVDVSVGDPNAVSDLIGVSYFIMWESDSLISNDANSAGTFFNPSPLFVAQSFADHVEVGVTSTSGGKSGTGGTSSSTFSVASTVAVDDTVTLYLSQISALDTSGANVSLELVDTLSVILKAPVNQPPVAQNDIVSVPEDSSMVIDALQNDNEPENEPMTITALLRNPANGVAAILSGDSSISYQPNANYFGDDTLAYIVSDGAGNTDSATVFITVTPVNDAPTLDAIADTSMLEHQTLSLTLNAADIDGDALAFAFTGLPAFADTASIANGQLSLTFMPDSSDAGSYVIEVSASDGSAAATGSFTLLVGDSTLVGITGTAGNLPANFELMQNYPNPFNPSTSIRYALPQNADVKLTIYNIAGQQVAELVNEHQQAGFHTLVFDAKQLASGVYFYHISAGSFSSVKKLMLLK